VSASSPTLLLFGHAKPIGEPVVAHGPFVMNTRDEIMEAIRDYQAGKFG
jgi:quercetin 2,3-dioxygenase